MTGVRRTLECTGYNPWSLGAQRSLRVESSIHKTGELFLMVCGTDTFGATQAFLTKEESLMVRDAIDEACGFATSDLRSVSSDALLEELARRVKGKPSPERAPTPTSAPVDSVLDYCTWRPAPVADWRLLSTGFTQPLRSFSEFALECESKDGAKLCVDARRERFFYGVKFWIEGGDTVCLSQKALVAAGLSLVASAVRCEDGAAIEVVPQEGSVVPGGPARILVQSHPTDKRSVNLFFTLAGNETVSFTLGVSETTALAAALARSLPQDRGEG